MHPHSKTPPKNSTGMLKGGKANQYGENRIIAGNTAGGHPAKRPHP